MLLVLWSLRKKIKACLTLVAVFRRFFSLKCFYPTDHLVGGNGMLFCIASDAKLLIPSVSNMFHSMAGVSNEIFEISFDVSNEMFC